MQTARCSRTGQRCGDDLRSNAGYKRPVNELLAEVSALSRVGLKVALTVALGLLTSSVLKRLVTRLQTGQHLTATMAARVQNLRRWVVLLGTGLIALHAAGLFDNAWALASAILAAVAIGFFAMWSLLSNMTSALIILVFRPFRVGDAIELIEPTNGTRLGGRVLDMNLMFTTLEMESENGDPPSLLHIPNNLFLQKTVRALPPATRLNSDAFFHDSLTGEIRSPFAPVERGRGPQE